MSIARPIYDLSPFSALDFPGHPACIVWFVGCNMRCQYCYNPQIVFGKGKFSYEDTFSFLGKRIGLLDGVVLSGGECTSHPSIVDFASKVKEMGFKLKLDTNGSHPDVIKKMIDQSLLDYVALDYKTLPQKFTKVTGSDLFPKFEKSLKILLLSDISFEVRTTVATELTTLSDLRSMAAYLVGQGYTNTHYLQLARTDIPTIGNLPEGFAEIHLQHNDFLDFPLRVEVRQ